MNASIRLQRAGAPSFRDQHVWPIEVTAIGQGMTSDIFVYAISKASDPVPGDVFEAVASVVQLSEIPTKAPATVDQVNQIPYYRRSSAKFNCRSAEEEARVWDMIVSQVGQLVRNYNRTAPLKVSEEIRITVDGPEAVSANPTIFPVTLSGLPIGLVDNAGNDQGLTVTDLPTVLENYYTALVENWNNDVPVLLQNDAYPATGWLPIEIAGRLGLPMPAGAKFFYNLKSAPALRALFPLRQPLSQHVLDLDGRILQHGAVYSITSDGIWWLDFPQDSQASFEHTGNAPWPLDYVNIAQPGAGARDLTLRIVV